MGAWIEILASFTDSMPKGVAPLVGAWIEIKPDTILQLGDGVAPLVGAWIEITILFLGGANMESHPLWVRG